jgi:hypothetical protein
MKQKVAILVLLFTLVSGSSAFLIAQQDNSQTSPTVEPEAMEALNRMGAYLRTLRDFQVTADVTTEVVLDSGEKLQSAQTTNLLAHAPNKLLVDVNGDDKSRLFLYDGKTFTLFARRAGFYATVDAPPTISELIDNLNEKYELEIPLLDLFLWGSPRATTKEISSASDVGPSQVGGVTCEHFAFRQPGLDWQVWIQLGEHPLPKKLVLTTTTDEARPQHISILTWNLAPSYNDATFVFDPPPDAHKITFAKNNESANK